jgi:hypothetical protein
MDNNNEVLYYMYGKDLYKYDLEDDTMRGLVRKNLGYMKLFFFWVDAMYTSDNTALYQVTFYWDGRIEPQNIVNQTGITAAALFISDLSTSLTNGLIVLAATLTTILTL